VLQSNPTALAGADARAQAMAAAWRRSGGDPRGLLASQPPAETLPPLPATTTFVTLDREGGAVACALSMDNLFGTGRLAPGVGFLLAASPRGVPLPLLAAAIATQGQTFRAAVGGSGQGASGLATAVAMTNALRSGAPRQLDLRPAQVGDRVAQAADSSAGRGATVVVGHLEHRDPGQLAQSADELLDVHAGPRMRRPPGVGGVDENPHGSNVSGAAGVSAAAGGQRTARASSSRRHPGGPAAARTWISAKSKSPSTARRDRAVYRCR